MEAPVQIDRVKISKIIHDVFSPVKILKAVRNLTAAHHILEEASWHILPSVASSHRFPYDPEIIDTFHGVSRDSILGVYLYHIP